MKKPSLGGQARAPLAQVMEDVGRFHAVFASTPAPTEPTLQNPERAMRRSDLIRERMDALLRARSIAGQASAYLDVIRSCVHGLLELGINPSPLWEIVLAAKMAERQPDGSVLRDPANGNKVVRPASWQDPTAAMNAEVARQMAEARKRADATPPTEVTAA